MSKNMTKLFEMFSTAAKALCLIGAVVIGLSAFAEADYLSFTARDGNAKLSLTKVGDPGELSLAYATDPSTNSWTVWDGGEVKLDQDKSLYLRRASGTATNVFCASAQNYYTFKMEPVDAGATVQGAGNIMSLVDQSCAATELGEFAFYGLFQNCKILTTAPMLAATTLARSCYGAMFTNCTSLVRMTAAFTEFSIEYTPSWMLGVGTEGVFIAPLTKIPQPSPASVPDSWICAKPSTVVIDPAGLANIESFVVSNGVVQIIPSVVGGKYNYVFGGKQEQAVVQLTPKTDCMVIGDNPFVLPTTALAENATTNITDKLVAQPIRWTIGEKTYPSLSWALRAVTNGVTLTGYDYLSSGVVTNDCNFAISNDDVTVDFAGLKPVGEEPQTFDVIAATNVTIKNGMYEGQVRLDAAGLVLDNATITNALPIAVTQNCSLSLANKDQLSSEGAKIKLQGVDATLSCAADFTLNEEIVADSSNKVYKPAGGLYAVAQAGSKWNPWSVGEDTAENVQAYTNGTGGLVIKGTVEGAVMKDFSTGDTPPWMNLEIKTVEVDANVETLGTYAFAGLTGIEVTFAKTDAWIATKAFSQIPDTFNDAIVQVKDEVGTLIVPSKWTDGNNSYATFEAAFTAGVESVQADLTVTPSHIIETEEVDGRPVTFVIDNYKAGEYKVPTVSDFTNAVPSDANVTELKLVSDCDPQLSSEQTNKFYEAITNGLPVPLVEQTYNIQFIGLDIYTNKAYASDYEIGGEKCITIFLPYSPKTASGFRVIRWHNSETNEIPYVVQSKFNDASVSGEYFTYDRDQGLLALRLQKFSPFAIFAYGDSRARIGETYYPTLQAALDAVTNNVERIDVLDNLNEAVTSKVAAASSVILNFGGYTNTAVTTFGGAGCLTVTNGVLAGGLAATDDFSGVVSNAWVDLCSGDIVFNGNMPGKIVLGEGVKSARSERFSAPPNENDKNRLVIFGPNAKFNFKQDAYLPLPKTDSKGYPLFVSNPDGADYKYTVIPIGDVNFRLVGTDYYYETLQDAFDRADDGSTIQLITEKFKLEAPISLNYNKNLTLMADSTGEIGTRATKIQRGITTDAQIKIEVGSTLTITNITFGGRKLVADKPMIEVNGTLVAQNNASIINVIGGAVLVKDGGQFVVDGNVQIWDNNGKNVVIENPATGLLLKTLEGVDGNGALTKGRIGIWTENYEAGQMFGLVDAAAFPYEFYCDGDITVDEPNVYFTNDRNPTLHHGRGATINEDVTVATTNSVRWTGGFAKVLAEGNALITRKGNQLVWLARNTNEVAQTEIDDSTVLGVTAGTVTMAVDAGYDYAVVTNGMAVTNWVSAVNPQATFEHVVTNVAYTLLKRYSITTNTLVSASIVDATDLSFTVSKYNAGTIASWFGEPCDTSDEGTLSEMAENRFVKVSVASNSNHNGYLVTLKKDSEHDWAIEIPDDAGKLVLDMHGFYLNAKDFQGKAGLSFVAALDYDGENPTDLTIENGHSKPYDHPSRIVGSRGANGANAVDTGDGANGVDGAVGIANMSANAVTLTLTGGVEVYGGTAGNGGNAVSGNGGNGGHGGAALTGNIHFELNGAIICGGNAGNGGDSTYGAGGLGGNGGVAIQKPVNGKVIAGGIYGGDAGIGGASGEATAGTGGNGGNAIEDPTNQVVVQGGDFSGDIKIRGGKGGVPNGSDGKGGKPAAPAPATVLNLTGTSVTLGVIKDCEYYFLEGVIVPDETAIPTNGWYKATDNKWFINGLTSATTYTVVARIPAKDGNLVSFYSSMSFTTMTTGVIDFERVFDGKATVTVDTNGEYVVTLTGDIDHGVRIPDRYGKFTLDMAGHSIVGLDGVKDIRPDGETAILFVPGGQDELTEVTIIGNGYIKGGDGAMRSEAVDSKVRKPNEGDGGNGGAGIAAEPLPIRTPNDPVVSNKVNFLNGTLEGGAGAKGADTLNGIAGNGGNGGDAYLDIERYPNYGVLFNYVRGTLIGGNGGNGGDAIGNLEDLTNGTPGNGGNGGDAINGQGGNGGNGGKSVGGNRFGQGGEEGNKGMEAPSIPGVPGGVSGDYRVRIGDPSSAGKVRYFMTLEEAFDAAKKDETITVFRDYTVVCPIEVSVNNLTLQTAGGVTLTLDENIIVNPEIEFTIDANCKIDESSIGTIAVNGTVNQKGGFAPNYEIIQDGVVIATAGKIGFVAVEEGGRFQVEYEANVTVTGSINANPMNVFLFGGTYEFDPSEYVRDPFTIDGEGPYTVKLNDGFAAMARVDDKIWGIKTLNEAFDTIEKSTSEIEVEVWLLQDATADHVLIDQDVVKTVIHGYGHTITDARTGDEADMPLFSISDNVKFENVVFDGQGTEAGQFLRLFETSAVVLDGCAVTGYACRNEAKGSSVTLPLISYSSAGEATVFVLRDTVITNNAVSAAISAIDMTGAGFKTHIGVAGKTTIEGSGVGILSDAKMQITAIDELTGGWIDVQYEGTVANKEFGRISIAGRTFEADYDYLEATASRFRYVGGQLTDRSCGNVVKGTDELLYLSWMPDARQYVAIIVRASGKTDYFETAEGAFGAVADKDTIILMQDATIRDMMTVKLAKATESYVVDLNGKTLTNDGNKLKLGTAAVRIINGTLTSASKYALYVYGATVALSNAVVKGDVHVAKGKLAIATDDVGVKGSIDKTNVGSVSITAGRFAENPSAYLWLKRGAYPADEASKAEGYNWIVSEATAATGFADRFELDISFDENGKATIDLRVEGIGKIRETESKIVYNGNVTGDVTVLPPKGWIANVQYIPETGKTVINFTMDDELLSPVFGSDDPGDRPLDFVQDGTGKIIEVVLRVKNAIPGFYYNMSGSADLTNWTIVSSTQATTAGNIELSTPNATVARTYMFFKVDVSDRSAK